MPCPIEKLTAATEPLIFDTVRYYQGYVIFARTKYYLSGQDLPVARVRMTTKGNFNPEHRYIPKATRHVTITKYYDQNIPGLEQTIEQTITQANALYKGR